jgi:TonB-linked SusC/RagA family outer membrane protein
VTVTLTRGANITENFSLGANPLRLGEVVVTGAGTSTTRERLTTTINTVDSTAIRRATQPQNIVSALAAQAPNVQVRTQSGEPGASAYIQIRGASSVTGTNQPLFVVDGQPIDNSTISTNGGDQSTVSTNRASDINPDDIQSIEILKGGAAAAIYGARAANGVVLITTKRGHAGATRYSISSTQAFDSPQIPNLVQRQWSQGNDEVQAKCAAVNCRLGSASWGAKLGAGTPTFDHENELFDTGLTSDNNVQVSGGSDRTTFFVSGGLNSQNGYFKGPNNKYTRASIRAKGTQQVGQKLDLGANISYIDDRGKYVQKGSNTSGVMLGALRTPPEFDNENTYTKSGVQRPYRFPNPGSATALAGAAHYDNPFFVLDNPGNRNELGRSISNVNADWNPLSWLNVKETLGGDYWSDWRIEALPYTSASQPLGQVIRYDLNNLQIDNNLIATATHTFGDNLDFTLTGGQNLNSRRYRDNFDLGTTLIAPSPLNLQNTLKQNDTEFRSLQHVEGYFGQAELDFFHQLVVNVGVRNDAFSTFGKSNPRANYPKASAAWTFTNWLNGSNAPGSGILSYGKLHVAYGETGKEPPVYAAVNGYAYNSVGLGGYGDALNSTFNGQGGVSSSFRLGNPNLRPERDRETEFGGDFAFFNSKVDLSTAYYDKRSSDVILAVPINASQFGATSRYDNAASVKNQGVEVTLNLHPVQTQNVAWDVGVQYGRNRGVVTSLAGAEFIPYNNQGFTGAIGSSTLGFAPGVIRGSDFIRCGRGLTLDDGTDVDQACGAKANGQHALYLGADGLPIPDPTDRVIADPNPKYTMSWSTSLKVFNKLTLSGLLDVRKGGNVWNGTRGVLNTIGTGIETLDRSRTDGQFGKNFLTSVYPYVAGPGAGVVAFKTPHDWEVWYSAFCGDCTGNGGGFGPVSEQFVENGGFVKLRELSATLTMDQPWVRRVTGFSSADLRVAGRNLHTWTKYTGFDPEANLGGGEFLTQGLDYFINPQVRSFVLSISLNR